MTVSVDRPVQERVKLVLRREHSTLSDCVDKSLLLPSASKLIEDLRGNLILNASTSTGRKFKEACAN